VIVPSSAWIGVKLIDEIVIGGQPLAHCGARHRLQTPDRHAIGRRIDAFAE
jgi:hypothetical protein